MALHGMCCFIPQPKPRRLPLPAGVVNGVAQCGAFKGVVLSSVSVV